MHFSSVRAPTCFAAPRLNKTFRWPQTEIKLYISAAGIKKPNEATLNERTFRHICHRHRLTTAKACTDRSTELCGSVLWLAALLDLNKSTGTTQVSPHDCEWQLIQNSKRQLKSYNNYAYFPNQTSVFLHNGLPDNNNQFGEKKKRFSLWNLGLCCKRKKPICVCLVWAHKRCYKELIGHSLINNPNTWLTRILFAFYFSDMNTLLTTHNTDAAFPIACGAQCGT